MPSNVDYRRPEDLPETIPIFPLPGALLLPRGQMPLNIFEPRYLAMIDTALANARIIGMIQPDPQAEGSPDAPSLYRIGCAGRITQFAETGDGRYLVQLTGVSRFRLVEELPLTEMFRQARVSYAEFACDLEARLGEEDVDREALISTLRAFSEANSVEIDWNSIQSAPNEALVNALSMMSPYGVREKQALLEAPTLKGRSDMLVAITEIELVRDQSDGPRVN